LLSSINVPLRKGGEYTNSLLIKLPTVVASTSIPVLSSMPLYLRGAGSEALILKNTETFLDDLGFQMINTVQIVVGLVVWGRIFQLQ